MTHDEARVQLADLFEGRQNKVNREALRTHLASCAACKKLYDQSALVLRRMLGAPEEMTEEELFLFEPPLPQAPAKVTPLFKPWPAVALAIAATLAGAVIYFQQPRTDDAFQPRMGTVPAELPGLRAVCMRGDQVMRDGCAAGDQVLFAVVPRGRKHVSLFVDGKLLGTEALSGEADFPLPWSLPWSPNLRATAVFGFSPLAANAALQCSTGTCAKGLEAVTVKP